jgi:hypothetical protein
LDYKDEVVATEDRIIAQVPALLHDTEAFEFHWSLKETLRSSFRQQLLSPAEGHSYMCWDHQEHAAKHDHRFFVTFCPA